ncbi:DUF1906 domain-containing protein [Streptomyces sp. NPDC048111]|uniref:DUF1906 domain-containing protein n=1 Tax=Streptomyces sp. NPDC048111 TaxID=3365500 RepID=UPI00372311F7
MRRLKLTLARSLTGLLAVTGLLASSAATPAVAASPPSSPASSAVAPPGAPGAPGGSGSAPTVSFKGAAFDTCNAPSLADMRAWRSSPYRAIGIYYAGRGRHCPVQRNLNKNWVTQVHAMGWQVLPVFLGSQAPCVVAQNKKGVPIGSRPVQQGRTEAGQAVEQARALGMLAGSALYLDLEAYDVHNASCARTTLDFVRAWNKEVRGRGYLPGFYSSADSGVRQIEQARVAGKSDMPAAIWFARWHTGPALYQEAALHKDAWQHRRIHQYAGDAAETHGGRRLVVDRNQVDAPVARIG